MGVNPRGETLYIVILFVGREVMGVKLYILPQGDGLNTVYVKRTLPSEQPGRSVADVSDAELNATVDRLVREMRREPEPNTP